MEFNIAAFLLGWIFQNLLTWSAREIWILLSLPAVRKALVSFVVVLLAGFYSLGVNYCPYQDRPYPAPMEPEWVTYRSGPVAAQVAYSFPTQYTTTTGS